MSEEDKKLKKHLVDEMMKVYETNPDVMFYMEALMKKYEELEQENINIKQQLLENKISLKDVEYQEKIKLQQRVEQLENIRKEAIKYVLKNKLYRFKYDDEELFEITTDKKAKDDLLNILNKGSEKE